MTPRSASSHFSPIAVRSSRSCVPLCAVRCSAAFNLTTHGDEKINSCPARTVAFFVLRRCHPQRILPHVNDRSRPVCDIHHFHQRPVETRKSDTVPAEAILLLQSPGQIRAWQFVSGLTTARGTRPPRDSSGLCDAVPRQSCLCADPTKWFVRQIVKTGIDERESPPRLAMTGLEVGDDSAKQRGQVDAVSTVTESIIDVVVSTGVADCRRGIERIVPPAPDRYVRARAAIARSGARPRSPCLAAH